MILVMCRLTVCRKMLNPILDDMFLGIVHYTKLLSRKKNISILAESLLYKDYMISIEQEVDNKSALNLDNLKKQTLSQTNDIRDLLYKNLATINFFECTYIEQLYQQDWKLELIKKHLNGIDWGKIALNSLSHKNIDLTHQHYAIFEAFLRSNCNYCLVLEDDSYINTGISHINESLYQVVEHAENNLYNEPFFIDLSQSLGIKPLNKPPDTYIWQATPGFSQCTSAYMINRNCSQKFLKESKTKVLPIDWHISRIMKKNNILCYSVWESLFLQGSMTEVYRSNSQYRAND
ncbi:hypothetical protein Syncc9902_0088 [Synechococcus sp. CC9902]|nr:hypothetical protein Syncc9902_0088 [Synechococcus sp. CC9902]